MKSKQALKPDVVLFDVYETLLDMADVERKVNALMDSRQGYAIWFEIFMQYCFVDNCTVQFNPFASIAKATLQMAGNYFRRSLDDHDIGDILELLKHLPLKEGVQSGLSALHDHGYRIAALTNSPEKIVFDRMERTGLISYFEIVLSAEHVQKYKPCVEVYDWAAGRLNTSPGNILLVSSHGWDIAGAANAGMKTAYIKQGKHMLYPLAPAPDIVCLGVETLKDELA